MGAKLGSRSTSEVEARRVLGASRVYGPDLTPILYQRAAAAGILVGFYGSTPEVLAEPDQLLAPPKAA
jgi:UDP-N-acetyl-D-mannosaminuronic acid transferase (WecB/TagA/CpsF family)